MANYTVQGFRPYSFTAKETGELVEGMSVFCSYVDETDKHLIGVAVDKFSISNKKLGDFKLKPGMVIEPLYNKYGKVESIRAL